MAMEFKSDRPIYRQIVDYCFVCILSGAWREGERVRSVREMSVEMSVNTHTVLKAYDFLQAHGIIEARRGMGYFLCEDARRQVNRTRKEDSFNNSAPELFAQMDLLGITEEDLVRAYREYKCAKQALPSSEYQP